MTDFHIPFDFDLISMVERFYRNLARLVQKIYPLDKTYPLNKSSSIYTSYPVKKYLSSGYSFEQLGPAYQILEVFEIWIYSQISQNH
jgi:hypothetical protein